MESPMRSHLLLFTLFLLVYFHGAYTKQFPFPPVSDHHLHEHVDEDLHLMNMIFFHQEDLKPGNSIPLYFPTKNPTKTPKFIPKQVSDSIPFSLSRLPSVLQTLQIEPTSPQAKSMARTLTHCEKPPIKGESKFCSTSLESMLDALLARFGPGSYPKLLTTSPRVGYRGLQTFKVLEDPKEIGAPTAMACHPMPYPYAVFYCHFQKESNKIYEMELETERDGKRVRVRVLGICHMDTSDWDPTHLAFGLLGIRPGEGPVCHAVPPVTLVWIPKPNPEPAVPKTVV